MADTLSTLTTDLKRVFQDAFTSACERALNLAHRDLISVAPDVARNETTISVASGTHSYDLPSDIGEVLDAVWRTGSAAGQRLKFTTRQQLGNDLSGDNYWAYKAAGTPEYYALEGNVSGGVTSQFKLILHPTPSVSTTAGFPAVVVVHSEAKTLANSDTIPEGATAASRFYRERAAMYLAQELRPDRVAEFKALSDEALQLSLRQWGLNSAEATPKDAYPRKR